jgi:hypothetical protein
MANGILIAAALCNFAASVVEAQVICEASASCSYVTEYQGALLQNVMGLRANTCYIAFSERAGNNITLDFSSLCNPESDYTFEDGIGHTYHAQICGLAAQPCMPKDWLSQYEYGRVIQQWGGPPTCNETYPYCFDQRHQQPECCTAPCNVRFTRPLLHDPDVIHHLIWFCRWLPFAVRISVY